MEQIEIGKIDDIPVLGARIVETAQGRVAVFRTGDNQVFALRDQCPHKQGPLSQGIISGYAVTCPLHNWKIDLASGEAITPDNGCTRTFKVQQKDDGRLLLHLQNES